MLPNDKKTLKSKTLNRVTHRYFFAISLIAGFSIFAFILNQIQHRILNEDFKTINISGRQRMLSQRISSLAEREDSPSVQTSLSEFKAGLSFLLASRFVNKDYPEVYDLYHGPDGIIELANTFTFLLNKNLNSSVKDQVFLVSQKILQKFDQATFLTQKISEKEYSRGLYLELIILFLTLTLLLLEVFFIFRPMTNEVSNAFQKMIDIEDKALQNARLAMIGESASSIGHEISNPLALIMANSESLLRHHSDSLNPSTELKVKNILKNSERVHKILHALKTQARLTVQDPMTSSQLGPIIHDALEMFTSQIRDHNIILEIDEKKSGEVICQKSAISQVVANLLSNAIDAVSEFDGEKKITIEVDEQENASFLRVRDSGPGVPVNMEEKIFESFITTKKEGKGTGLGLAISRKIMEEHGGKLRLNTSVSRSCFEMVFLNS